jgi:hypothetical protein
VIYQGNPHLTDDFLLKVERSADDRDGITIQIATVLSRGGVHGDEFFQLWR